MVFFLIGLGSSEVGYHIVHHHVSRLEIDLFRFLDLHFRLPAGVAAGIGTVHCTQLVDLRGPLPERLSVTCPEVFPFLFLSRCSESL